jgi:branched-chain amino acid transport system ATP-binding protein
VSYLLHNGIVVFLAFVLVMGTGAWAIGRALATTWRPMWHCAPYAVLLGLAGRLVFWGLSGGNNEQFIEAFSQIFVDLAVLAGAAAGAYRLTQTRKMVTQYPWLYEQTGPFGWRQRPSAEP